MLRPSGIAALIRVEPRCKPMEPSMQSHPPEKISVDLALPLSDILRRSTADPYPEIPLPLPDVSLIEGFYLRASDAVDVIDELVVYYETIIQHLRKYTHSLQFFRSHFKIWMIVQKENRRVEAIHIYLNSNTAALIRFLVYAAPGESKVFYHWPIDEYHVTIEEQAILIDYVNVHAHESNTSYILDRQQVQVQLLASNEALNKVVQTLNTKLGATFFEWPPIERDIRLYYYPALASPDPTARMVAVEALAELGDKKAGEALLPLLDDPSLMVRTSTIKAFAALNYQPAGERLLELLPQSSDRTRALLISVACQFLRARAADAAVDAYVEHLADPGEHSQDAKCELCKKISNALYSLGRATVPALLTHLQRQDQPYPELLTLLGHTHDPRAYEPLLALARSDAQTVEARCRAISLLGLLADRRAIPELVAMREDPRESAAIKNAAQAALSDFTP
jgi:hypothetical protein